MISKPKLPILLQDEDMISLTKNEQRKARQGEWNDNIAKIVFNNLLRKTMTVEVIFLLNVNVHQILNVQKAMRKRQLNYITMEYIELSTFFNWDFLRELVL